MGSAIEPILDYVGHSALLTFQQFAIVLGPLLLLAFILDRLSNFTRNRAARILGRNAYVYLTAPGVMVHELGHAFFCVIFRHRITGMHLFRPGRNGTLGSVEHSFDPRSIYQRIGNFFIGTGPIWFGTTLVCLIAWYLLGSTATYAVRDLNAPTNPANLAATASHAADSAWQLFIALLQPSLVSTWTFWICAYLIFCIGSHITLSRSDIKGAAGGLICLVAFVFLFNLVTLSLRERWSVQACQHLLQASVVFYAGILLVIWLNLALAVILFVLSFVLR